MPDLITAADEAVLQRRGFLRGGALLAAAAGGAVAATAGSVLPASADTPHFSTFTIAVPPERLLDTRTEVGRTVIVASSSSAFDSKHRLKGDAWMDVAVAKTVDVENFGIAGIFVNLKGLASTGGGSLVVTAPGDDQPTGTTVTYRKGETVTNSAFVGVGVTGDQYVVRIYTTSTSHVTLDITGASIVFDTTAPTLQKATRTSSGLVAKAIRSAGR